MNDYWIKCHILKYVSILNYIKKNCERNVKGKWKLNFKNCNRYQCVDTYFNSSIQHWKIGGASGTWYDLWLYGEF